MQHHTKKPRKNLAAASKSGFTIVELTLTMSFVAVLLITIAIVTTNIVTIYQKGLTLKAVNSVGRSLVDEFTTAISTAPTIDRTSLCRNLIKNPDASQADTAIKKCEEDNARNYIFQERLGEPPEEGDFAGDKVQYGGIFCTGNYSYLWNTYYGIETGHTLGLEYLEKSANGSTGSKQKLPQAGKDDKEQIRLIRINDPTYRLCSAATDPGSYEPQVANLKNGIINDYYSIDITEKANSTQDIPLSNPIPQPESGLLSEFDLDLLLYELKVFKQSQDNITRRIYMAGTFILATGRGNVDVTRSGDYCNINDIERFENQENQGSGSIFDSGSEFNYCAINKFNFASRTAGVQKQ